MTNLRSFVFGTMFGIAALIGTLAFISYTAGIKWQPVRTDTVH